MNDEFNEIEASLRRLTPRAPSSRVWSVIEHRLDAPTPEAIAPEETSWTSVRRLWLPPVGLAAACLGALLLWPAAETSQNATDRTVAIAASPANEGGARLYPVSAEKILCSTEDEGLISLANGRPARTVRQEYIDVYTWRDPRTNASLRWTMPREEVRVIPVSTY